MSEVYILMKSTAIKQESYADKVVQVIGVYAEREKVGRMIDGFKRDHDTRNDGLCSERDIGEDWRSGNDWRLIYIDSHGFEITDHYYIIRKEVES